MEFDPTKLQIELIVKRDRDYGDESNSFSLTVKVVLRYDEDIISTDSDSVYVNIPNRFCDD
jgi:hypothetical protein